MNLTRRARSAARRIVEGLARRTLLGPSSTLRTLGFHAVGSGSELVACGLPGKEWFIVSARDEIIGRDIFVKGEFDFGKFETALELLRQHRRGLVPRVLVDVGANIGPICIPAVARKLIERAIAIEPDPQNCRLLRANIELNGLGEAITVRQMAAGSEDGQELRLELSEHNWGDHRITAPGPEAGKAQSGRRAIPVASNRLDTICSGEDSADLFLWIDVQGFEGFVLEGASALLGARPPVVVEFWPIGLARSGSYSLLRQTLAPYEGFWDLSGPARLRPIAELDALFGEIGEGEDRTTDILVV
jgi:FkbM family methyltransferase